MWDGFSLLFDTSDFPARWYCGQWSSVHGWTHIVSDLLVFGAYAAIPVVLAYFVRKKPEVPFPKVFWCFVAFIFTCGTVHLVEAGIFWWPAYRLSAATKVLTAVASWGTVVALVPILPRALAMRTTEELEREIEQRKRAQQELAEKHEQLLQAERLKSEFFANVSHELRTPLTLILAPLESLLSETDGKLGPDGRHHLQTMHNNGVRLLQLVNGLLDFSKLEAGRIEPHREPLEAASVTRSILRDFKPALRRKNLQFDVETDPDSMPVQLDRYLYERIVFNLLSNAVKFTPEGGRIAVRLSHENGRLRLSVRDTGIGISAEDREHLFQRFRQLESPSTRRFEGTGLGLAMVREFAELLEGSVSVESTPGEGSTFIVDCAAPPTDAEAVHTQRLGPTAGASGPARYAGTIVAEEDSAPPSVSDGKATPEETPTDLPEVLIAEDNVELAAYAQSLLRGLCHCRVARDGAATLREFRRQRPDLVLADVMMPEKDGLTLCREIKAEPGGEQVPVVLLTALTHRDALLEGWEAGADEYLFKPFHPQELVTRVRTLLALVRERKRSRQAVQRSQQYYRSLLEHAQDIVSVLEPDGTIRDETPAAERILGYAPEDKIGRRVFEFMHPEDGPRVRAVFEEGIREPGAVRTVEFRMRHKDGTWRILESIGKNLVQDPAVRAAVVNSRDVTERRRAEQTVGTLLEISHELNSTLDVDALLDQLVQQALRLVDAESGCAGLRNPEGMAIQRYFKQGELLPLDYRWPPGHGLPGWLIEHRRPYRTNDAATDGQVVHELCDQLEVTQALSTPVLDSRGEVVGFFEVHNKRDGDGFSAEDEQKLQALSAAASVAIQNALAYRKLKQAERDLRAARDELEHRVSQRTAELQQSNEDMERFLYTVSHDLRTPLVTIQGFAGLLREDLFEGDHDEVLSSAGRIERAAKHMEALIEDLLQISRVTRSHSEPEEVDVEALLEELVQELAVQIEAAGARVEVEPALPALTADRRQVRQAFENLLNNALKYGCEAPGARVSIGAVSSETEVRYFVRDEGPGIPERFHDTIFNLFQRLDNSSEGTGLGLAIVGRILDVHGGRAWVESAPGEGATFWLAFPANLVVPSESLSAMDGRNDRKREL